MLPEPECRLGYTMPQLREILGERFDEFGLWMRGQTMAICDGTRYNHDTKTPEEACGGFPHGVVVYVIDLQYFLAGMPVID